MPGTEIVRSSLDVYSYKHLFSAFLPPDSQIGANPKCYKKMHKHQGIKGELSVTEETFTSLSPFFFSPALQYIKHLIQ